MSKETQYSPIQPVERTHTCMHTISLQEGSCCRQPHFTTEEHCISVMHSDVISVNVPEVIKKQNALNV
jgi:hypothetical protein